MLIFLGSWCWSYYSFLIYVFASFLHIQLIFIKNIKVFCCFISFGVLKIYFCIHFFPFYERALYCFVFFFCCCFSTVNSYVGNLKRKPLLYFICLKTIDCMFKTMVKLKAGATFGGRASFCLAWATTFSLFTNINVKTILIKEALLKLVFVCLSDWLVDCSHGSLTQKLSLDAFLTLFYPRLWWDNSPFFKLLHSYKTLMC